jgi:hypothetical protein
MNMKMASMLGLFLVTGPAVSAVHAEAVSRPQVVVHVDGAQTRFLMRFGSIAALTTPAGETLGIQLQKQAGEVHRVDILRAVSDAHPRTLARPDYVLVESIQLREGAAVARTVSQGVDLEVSLPVNAANDVEVDEGDTAGCCVTCSNGVVICGSRVRSSCGNCN